MNLARIILREELTLPWPGKKSAILQGSHPLGGRILRWSAGRGSRTRRATQSGQSDRTRGITQSGRGDRSSRPDRQPTHQGSDTAQPNTRLSPTIFNTQFSKVARSLYLPIEHERRAQDVQHCSQVNGLGFAYKHHMISRIRARVLAKPNTQFTGWAALRILGLPYWINDMPLQVATTNRGQSPRSEYEPFLIRESFPDAISPRALWAQEFLDLPPETTCTSAEVALARALIGVLRGRTTWWIPSARWFEHYTGLTAPELRALQLLDAVQRFLKTNPLRAMSPGSHPVFAPGQLNQRQVRRLFRLSARQADSPIETLLRVLIQTVLPDVRPQVPLWNATLQGHAVDEEIPMTTADLWSDTAKIAIFYDGKHHDSDDQRHIDAKVDRHLQTQGIRVLRFTSRDLKVPVHIINEIEIALATR